MHESSDTPWLSGEVLYNLRCSFLHEGNPNLGDVSKIKEERNRINKFEIVVEEENEFNIFCDHASVTADYYSSLRTYRLSLRRLRLIIGETAVRYYVKNKEKFDLANYTISTTYSIVLPRSIYDLNL